MKEIIKDENFYFMSVNVWAIDCGLSKSFYATNFGFKYFEEPCIKITKELKSTKDGELLSISISDCPEIIKGEQFITDKELKSIKDFIILNKDLLLQHWEGKIDDDFELYQNIKKVKKI